MARKKRLIVEYLEKKALVADIEGQLERIENNSEYQNELDFKNKLYNLMEENGIDRKEVVKMLMPEGSDKSTQSRKPASWSYKEYANPHTGETIQAKTKANKKLKEWISEYGEDAVLSWKKS